VLQTTGNATNTTDTPGRGPNDDPG